jgi:hypothetical protein
MNLFAVRDVKSVLALVLLLSIAALAFFADYRVTPATRAQSGASLALDADASNGSGACSPVDSSADYAEGEEFQVAVCLTNSGEVPLAAFQFRVTYDDRIVIAPEVADGGEGLDDNPDANAGATTFSSPDLGGGWDCSGGVGAYPEGDDDGERNGIGVAWSGGCGSIAPGGKSFTQGPLVVIRFRAEGGGETRLTPTQVSVTADDLTEVGSCDPGIDAPMDCEGATITVTGAPVPGVTPGAIITPGTPSIGGTPVPGAQESAVAEETAVALGTPIAGFTPGAAGSPGPGTAGAAGTGGTGTPQNYSDTRTPSRTRTPATGITTDATGDDDDDGGSNTAMWAIIAGVAVAAVAGGGAAYWYRFRRARV